MNPLYSNGNRIKLSATLFNTIFKFPKFAKLYMVQGQIHQQQSNNTATHTSFVAGIKACPKEPTFWILVRRLKEADGRSIKAHVLLNKARQANPGNDVLPAETARVEERSRAGSAQAKATLLQECPSSGLLWLMVVWVELRALRKMKGVDMLRKTKDSPVYSCVSLVGGSGDRESERLVWEGNSNGSGFG